MPKTYITLEEAIAKYNAYFGKAPTEREIEHLYHNYRNSWKQYKDFDQFLNNV